MKIASLYVDQTCCKILYNDIVYTEGGAIPILELLRKLFEGEDIPSYLICPNQNKFFSDFHIVASENAYLLIFHNEVKVYDNIEDEKDFKNLVRRISKIESEQYLLRFEPDSVFNRYKSCERCGTRVFDFDLIPKMEQQHLKPWDEWSDRQKGHIIASNIPDEVPVKTPPELPKPE